MSKSKPSPKQEQQVSGIIALLDNPLVEGYEVKEWSIKQFSLLYPYLKEVVNTLMAQGMSLANADEYLQKNYMSLVDAFVPVLPEVLQISLNLTNDQLEKISAATGSVLGISILQKNMEHIKTFLAQIKGGPVR